MMKKACQYAVIQFMPHPETREFANIGVVLLCPAEKFFGFRLLKKYGRVTRFFEQMDNKIFIEGKHIFQDELVRMRKLFAYNMETHQDITPIQLFADMTRKREGIFRFGDPGTTLTENAKGQLDELYKFYVEREFVTKEYQERVLEKAVRRILSTAHLADKFKDREIGDDLYHVRFPFVAFDETENMAAKIIKPLCLDQKEPTKIYAHADMWLPKIKRLRERNLLPQAVLFPLTAPPANDDKCGQAYQEVQKELEQMDVQVTKADNEDAILSFAKG